MRLNECTILIVVGIVAIAGLVGYVSSLYLGDDNPIEEAAEEVIELETGRKIDLSALHHNQV